MMVMMVMMVKMVIMAVKVMVMAAKVMVMAAKVMVMAAKVMAGREGAGREGDRPYRIMAMKMNEVNNNELRPMLPLS